MKVTPAKNCAVEKLIKITKVNRNVWEDTSVVGNSSLRKKADSVSVTKPHLIVTTDFDAG